MLTLTDGDQAMLNGDRGPASQLAMSILVRMAPVYGAATLMGISPHRVNAIAFPRLVFERDVRTNEVVRLAVNWGKNELHITGQILGNGGPAGPRWPARRVHASCRSGDRGFSELRQHPSMALMP